MHTRWNTLDSINAVLGDASFIHTFGVAPPPGTDESLRIRTHLAYVEQLLRAAPVQHLAREQRQKRAYLLDKLHEYWQQGRFPKNTAFPHERRPCFIDDEGSICAVGYLVEQDSGREVAERINTLYQYEYVPQMDAPFVQEWVQQSGLSVEECSMIQPGYGFRHKIKIGHSVFPDELRTPLSAIISFSSILRDEYLTLDKDELREISESIQISANRLNHILYRILDCQFLLDRIKNHPDVIESLRTEKTYLNEVEDFINTVLKDEYSEYAQDFIVSVDSNCGEHVIAISEDHFRVIVSDVAGNVSKFSNRYAPIEVEGRKEGSFYQITFYYKGKVENGLVEKYNDIESILAKALFDTYHVSEWELVHTISILYIYGGSIKVESTEEEMTITLLIPFEPLEMIPLQKLQSLYGEERLRDLQSLYEEEERERYETQRLQAQRKTILIIVDDVSLREFMIKYFLEKEGYTVITAEDGEIGVEKAKHELPSLIICDLMMPKINGYEVRQTLQKHEPTAHIPFIFFTVLSDRANVRDSMGLSDDHFLTTPFVSQELVQAVAKIRERGRRYFDSAE